jgi:hypothetical protein
MFDSKFDVVVNGALATGACLNTESDVAAKLKA